MTRVFISHQEVNSKKALDISIHIKSQGIDTYLDVLDPYFGKNPVGLTNFIKNNIDSSTHLLIVLSEKTKLSWWVPFEIGIVTDQDKPIVNYFIEKVEIPEYLQMWPYLQTTKDIDKYISMIKKGKSHLILEKRATKYSLHRTSDIFHEELKKSLGQ